MGEPREADRGAPWAWFVGGCAFALVSLAVLLAGAIFFGSRWAHRTSEAQKDPTQRTAKALEILGCERLPEGYESMAALSIPIVADVAVLTDRPPDSQGRIRKFGDHGLIFLRTMRLGGRRTELENYFSGKTDDLDVLRRSHINIRVDEIVKRGVIEGPPRMMYLVERGGLDLQQGRTRGILSLILVDCPNPDKLVLAIWFGPDPAPGEEIDEAALAGTTGDEKSIAEFMSRFHLCPR